MYMMELADRGLPDETRMMRDVTRKFVERARHPVHAPELAGRNGT